MQSLNKNSSIWIKAYKCVYSFLKLYNNGKNPPLNFRRPNSENSLLWLTDSLSILAVALFAVAPRWPRHTTFENNKLHEESYVKSLTYFTHIITFSILFTSFVALICIVMKDIKKIIIVDISSFKFSRRLRSKISKLKRLMGWSLFMSLILVLSKSVRE